MTTLAFTENTWGHEVTSFQFGVTGRQRLPSTKHSGSLETQEIDWCWIYRYMDSSCISTLSLVCRSSHYLIVLVRLVFLETWPVSWPDWRIPTLCPVVLCWSGPPCVCRPTKGPPLGWPWSSSPLLPGTGAWSLSGRTLWSRCSKPERWNGRILSRVVTEQQQQQQQVRPHLSLRQEVPHERSLHCVFQLAVFKDEEGGFSPHLQGHLLHPLRRHFHHLKQTQRGSFLSSLVKRTV